MQSYVQCDVLTRAPLDKSTHRRPSAREKPESRYEPRIVQSPKKYLNISRKILSGNFSVKSGLSGTRPYAPLAAAADRHAPEGPQPGFPHRHTRRNCHYHAGTNPTCTENTPDKPKCFQLFKHSAEARRNIFNRAQPIDNGELSCLAIKTSHRGCLNAINLKPTSRHLGGIIGPS